MRADDGGAVLRPARLRAGDEVWLVSPASTPDRDGVEATVRFLEGLGLRPSLGAPVFDSHGYLAGRDEDRLADLTEALREPDVAAVVATTGGKGAYRIAENLDFAVAARHPKLLVGFSEVTILHMALWQRCRLAGLHGALFEQSWAGAAAAAPFLDAVSTCGSMTLRSRNRRVQPAPATQGDAKPGVAG